MTPPTGAEDAVPSLASITEWGGDLATVLANLDELRGALAASDKRVQRKAAEVLGALAGASAEIRAAIGAALAADDRASRWGAAFAEACSGAPSPAAGLVWVESLGSADRDLRWAAHDLIVRHAAAVGSEPIARLCAAAGDGSHAERRKMALYCLRDLDPSPALGRDAVMAALDAEEIEVRLAALAALAQLAPDGAGERVAAYLDDPEPRMRRAAAAALGKLGELSPAILDALRRAENSTDSGLARAASRALRAVAASD